MGDNRRCRDALLPQGIQAVHGGDAGVGFPFILSLYAFGFFRKHIFYKNLLFPVDILRKPVYNSSRRYSANVVIS